MSKINIKYKIRNLKIEMGIYTLAYYLALFEETHTNFIHFLVRYDLGESTSWFKTFFPFFLINMHRAWQDVTLNGQPVESCFDREAMFANAREKKNSLLTYEQRPHFFNIQFLLQSPQVCT